MDVLWQNPGNLADDVAAKEVDEHVPLRCAKDQARGANGGCDIDNGVCGRPADGIAGQHDVSVGFLPGIFKYLAGFWVFHPFALAISSSDDRLLADEEEIERSVGFTRFFNCEVEGFFQCRGWRTSLALRMRLPC